jgi:GntR family transcriptional regulator, transcriptional repressor for pyruvate dehydrogenase complex
MSAGARADASLDTVFAPVRSQTAFEETVDRLGTAIKLGLLSPGTRLPPERELCSRLGIARSTLRQALTALTESGHLYAVRGRGGGTFVADPLPPADRPDDEVLSRWRDVCDVRLAIEFGVVTLACQRAATPALDQLGELVERMDDLLAEYEAFRAADVRFHIGLAEASGSGRLVSAMTESQGEMTDLISHIPHPPEVLLHSNEQHARILAAVRAGDAARALGIVADHLHGTEHVLAGLLPDA